MTTGLCSRIDNCQKVAIIMDKDILEGQAADAIRDMCAVCPEPKDVIAMCDYSDSGVSCVGGGCPMFKRCWLPAPARGQAR